ncbi:MAG: ABC transporter substrate-binding protein [Rubrivivax sp.]|nr:ABC transporter substrate-binding protein [Rubrivivax sp.]
MTRLCSFVATLACLTFAIAPAGAKTFRLATTSDAATLDPHANNAFINVLVLQQIYEPLICRDDDLKLEPCLAVRWEQPEPTRWRFHLRPGVKFHNGSAFDADDVVFSIQRAKAPTSNYGVFVDTVADVVKVDAMTVDVITRVADAVIPDKMTRIFIMDKDWSVANRSEKPQNFREKEDLFAARNTNGTGPYVLRSRQLDVRTVLALNPAWWSKVSGNVTEYHHVIIASDSTRVSALISGDVDFVHVLPVQDIPRLRSDPRLKVLEGQENRTLWLGMDQSRDELLYSNIKGRNPFKDVRVRRAVALAIDVEAIKRATLRGQGVPSGSMWTQYVNGWSASIDQRPAVDREQARRLLAEAGYREGFRVTLDCPVGAYEGVCLAIAAMLAQINVEVQVNVMPTTLFFQKIQREDTSFYGLTWGVPTFDALYTMRAIMMSQEKFGSASWNFGHYSNPRVDELVGLVERETDAEKRRAFIREAHQIHNSEVGHIPLYHLMIPMASSAKVTAKHRADNLISAKTVRIAD